MYNLRHVLHPIRISIDYNLLHAMILTTYLSCHQHASMLLHPFVDCGLVIVLALPRLQAEALFCGRNKRVAPVQYVLSDSAKRKPSTGKPSGLEKCSHLINIHICINLTTYTE